MYFAGAFQGCYEPAGTASGGGVGPGNENGAGGGGGGGSGGGSRAGVANQPNSHSNCVTASLEAANAQGSDSQPSDPNSSAAIPFAYANPIDVSNGNPLGVANGGVNGGRGGFMIFPNMAKGWAAARASVSQSAMHGKSVQDLIDKWAPPASDPYARANTLAGFGMSASAAASTQVSQLSYGQADQLIGAFAWQEGFKPTGC